jgi:hypothetical protein
LGALQGRGFRVLMDRLPIAALQARLDAAKARYGDSPTLADFRAPAAIEDAEAQALAAAQALITAHPEIAALHPDKTQLLDWAEPAPMRARRGGRTLLFPYSALARKGAYALREALQGLDLEVLAFGKAMEAPGFWGGLNVRPLWPGETLPDIAAVVAPALVEHQPRALLSALAAGIPVVATAACGLGRRQGVTTVPAMDAPALRAALAAI